MTSLKVLLKRSFLCFVAFTLILPSLLQYTTFAAEDSIIIDEMVDKKYSVSSAGYEYKTFAAAKFGDYTRAIITGNGLGEMVYSIKDYAKMDVVLYRNQQGGDLLLYTSDSSNGEYVKASEDILTEKVVDRQGGWEKVIYTLYNPNNKGFAKLKWYDPDLSPNLHAQRYMHIYGVSTDYFKNQIGAVIRYKNTDDLIPEKVEIDAQTRTVFSDDFGSLDLWSISDNYKEMISAKTVDNKTCAVIDSTKEKVGTEIGDPYIKTKSLETGYDTYEIRLSLMMDTADTERVLSVKTQNGDYIYPVVFSSDGSIGVKKNNANFEAIDCDYSQGIWYDIRCVVDTKKAEEIVYVNGKKVTENPIKLLDGGTEGGISELRISQVNKGGNGSVMYLDKVSVSRTYALENAEMVPVGNESVTLNDIYYHWARENIKSVVASGVMQGVGENKFLPDGNITVAEFIKLIVGATGNSIDESNDDWSGAYIDYAIKNAYIAQDEFEDFMRPITRLEMARIISRVTEKESLQEDEYEYSEDIKDFKYLNQNDGQVVLDVYSKGIMSGDAENCFNAYGNATRAEAACVAQRIMDLNMRRYSRYVVGIYFAEDYADAAEGLSEHLENSGIMCKMLSKEDMADETALNAKTLDCVFLLNSIENDTASVETFREFAEDGGDIVLAGKDIRDSLSTNEFKIPLFGNGTIIKAHLMNDIYEIKSSDESGQDIIAEDFSMAGNNWSGEKAIAFDTVFRSKAIPVLKAYDKWGREAGYAAGVLVNYGTSYEDSNMLYYGIDQKEFYESDGFAESAAQTLKKFSEGELENRWSYKEEYQKNFDAVMAYEMTQPEPKGRVHVSKDGTHLVDGEENDLFLNGVNVLGDFSFTYNGSNGGYGQFCIEEAEASFKNMHDLGINYVRLWNSGVEDYGGDYSRQVAKVLRDLCRKYGIYIELVGGTGGVRVENQSVDAVIARMDEKMELWAGEPMLLAYDYANEPDLVEMIYQFGIYGDAPLDKYDIYGEYKDIIESSPSWNTYYKNKGSRMANIKDIASEERFKQVASLFTLYMMDNERFVTGTNKLYNGHLEGIRWKASENETFSKAMNEIISNGLSAVKQRLHQWDPDCLFTIGFDSSFCVVPAMADYLDIWNQHVYRATDPPYPMSKTIQQFTGYDTLAELSDKIPSMYGEYQPPLGKVYSFGSEKQVLSEETADVISLFTILYPYSKGYGGTNVWQYEQRAPHRLGWVTDGAQLYGIERFSGNSDPQYRHMDRLMGHELRFFKKFADRDGSFGTGNMEWFQSDTQCDTGFKFTAEKLEYVYGNKFSDELLSFDASDNELKPVVMLDWNDGKLEIMATAKVSAKIDLSKCISKKDYKALKVDGFYDDYKIEDNLLEISLLDNSVVVVSSDE